MTIDTATVRRAARLARIHVAEDELDALAGELADIIGWVEQLAEVDTDGVAPLTSVAEMALKMRDDRVTDGGDADGVLANAPETRAGHYVVQKVVE